MNVNESWNDATHYLVIVKGNVSQRLSNCMDVRETENQRLRTTITSIRVRRRNPRGENERDPLN